MRILRERWLPVLVFGLALFLASLLVASFHKVFFPVAVVIGAFLAPVTFVTYIGEYERGVDRERHNTIPISTITWLFITAGVVGVGGASVLEFATLKTLGVPQLFGVGLIEEGLKMVLPLVFYFIGRYRSEADGLLFGITAGMGFAALETIGYGFFAYTDPHTGGLGSLAQVLIIRGLFSPANHAAWTGMVCAILWRERFKAKRRVLNIAVIGTFVLAIVLHAFWDIISGFDSIVLITLGYFAIAAISLSIIIWRMKEARKA